MSDPNQSSNIHDSSAGSASGSPDPYSASASGSPDPYSGSASGSPAAPGSTAGAGTMSAAQAGSALRRIGIGNPLPTFVVGALAYIAALGASLVVLASLFLAALTGGPNDIPSGGTDPLGAPSGPGGGSGASPGDGWRVIVGLLGIPFQLVALGTFGSYGMELDLGFLGSAEAGWRGMPLLITVALTATAFLGARFVQRRWGSGRWGSNGPLGALLWSGVSGFALAVFALLVTRVTAFAFVDDSVGMSVSMYAAGADMFLGTWLLSGLALFLGHLAGSTKPSWWPLVADLAAAPRLALVHALSFAIPVGVVAAAVSAIRMVVDGEGSTALTLFLLLPVWGLTGLGVLVGLGMLLVPVHVTTRGDLGDFGSGRVDEFLWFFDLPWYVWIPMVLFAVLVLLAIPLLWNRDRVIAKDDVLGVIASWLALPVAYFVCSLVLLALVWTSVRVEMGMLGDGAFALALGAWMPLVAFVIGAIVELLARFVAPLVDRFVPGVLLGWFRRSERLRRAETAASNTP